MQEAWRSSRRAVCAKANSSSTWLKGKGVFFPPVERLRHMEESVLESQDLGSNPASATAGRCGPGPGCQPPRASDSSSGTRTTTGQHASSGLCNKSLNPHWDPGTWACDRHGQGSQSWDPKPGKSGSGVGMLVSLGTWERCPCLTGQPRALVGGLCKSWSLSFSSRMGSVHIEAASYPRLPEPCLTCSGCFGRFC